MGEVVEAMGGEVVFPDAEDAPAFFAECAGDFGVAEAVAAEFFAPEAAVGGGAGAVGGATRTLGI